MLAAVDSYLSARSPFQLGIYSLVLLAVVGTIDYSTGYELSFSIFYAIPVGLSAWYLGRRFGLLFSILSALVLFLVDAAAGHPYIGTTSPYWNTGVPLGFFLIITVLLDTLHRALDALASQAQRDGLTGLLNDRTFRERCRPAFALAARHGRTVALGYIDLDGFKGINDRSGHAVGDQVLREVAAAIMKLLRGTDFAGRLGGDEFGVLLVETTPDGPADLFRPAARRPELAGGQAQLAARDQHRRGSVQPAPDHARRRHQVRRRPDVPGQALGQEPGAGRGL